MTRIAFKILAILPVDNSFNRAAGKVGKVQLQRIGDKNVLLIRNL